MPQNAAHAVVEQDQRCACRQDQQIEPGGSGVLEYWMETGMAQEPKTVAQLIFDLSSAAMRLHGR